MSTPEELQAAVDDYFPALIIGITSIFTVIWWFVLMFVFVKNDSSDDNLKHISGVDTYPIAFMWERLGATSGLYVHLALALMTGFILQIFVSFIELLAWIVYMVGDDLGFFSFWASVIGYWGSLVLYGVPFIFSVL